MRVTSISPQISKILGSRSAITTIATACIGDLDHDRDLMDERHPLNAHVGDESILEALLASALGAKLPCNVLQAPLLGPAGRDARRVPDHLGLPPAARSRAARYDQRRSQEELGKMKKGSYLIKNARGKVVDLPALVRSLRSRHFAGRLVDVYLKEPKSMSRTEL